MVIVIVRIFKVNWFSRFAAKEVISDGELKDLMNNVLEKGLAEADLGGSVYKVRLARPNEGKSGGYRVIVLFKNGALTFFIYGFAKSVRGNISPKELAKFEETAKDWLSLSDEQLNKLVQTGKYQEQCHIMITLKIVESLNGLLSGIQSCRQRYYTFSVISIS